jgi:protein-S-isoprenylcysteine O-methyltransferase Ste14
VGTDAEESQTARCAVSPAERAAAIVLGALCHGTFGIAIAAMIASLHQGLRLGFGHLAGPAAWLANGALALSFPALHSWLLTPRGGRALAVVSRRHGAALLPTTYALVASLQLLAVFGLWSPAGHELWRAEGALGAAFDLAYGASGLVLGKAMLDAGLAVQTGWLGWSAVARGQAVRHPRFTPRGLFRFTRQPVYLAFACTLWTSPLLTTDRLLLAATWTAYCVLGPLHKERRQLARDPDGYGRYQASVPYWLPRLAPKPREC